MTLTLEEIKTTYVFSEGQVIERAVTLRCWSHDEDAPEEDASLLGVDADGNREAHDLVQFIDYNRGTVSILKSTNKKIEWRWVAEVCVGSNHHYYAAKSLDDLLSLIARVLPLYSICSATASAAQLNERRESYFQSKPNRRRRTEGGLG